MRLPKELIDSFLANNGFELKRHGKAFNSSYCWKNKYFPNKATQEILKKQIQQKQSRDIYY